MVMRAVTAVERLRAEITEDMHNMAVMCQSRAEPLDCLPPCNLYFTQHFKWCGVSSYYYRPVGSARIRLRRQQCSHALFRPQPGAPSLGVSCLVLLEGFFYPVENSM